MFETTPGFPHCLPISLAPTERPEVDVAPVRGGAAFGPLGGAAYKGVCIGNYKVFFIKAALMCLKRSI